MLFSSLGRWRARRRKVAQLTRALQRIPAPLRAVYVMCAVGRRSQSAVARALGLTVVEVQERLADALVALAAILDETAGPTVAPDDTSR